MDSTTILLSGEEGTLKMLSEIALVVFTAILAWATIKLAQHTQALSKLTERLVKIETTRDERDQQENRRRDLKTALAAAESIQMIYPGEFAQHLNKPANLPLSAMTDIETLHSLKKYIKDPDCQQHLEVLCNSFDSVRREKSQVRVNEEDIALRVNGLKDRIQWCVNEWRTEIASG